jgi:hypothetical protein
LFKGIVASESTGMIGDNLPDLRLLERTLFDMALLAAVIVANRCSPFLLTQSASRSLTGRIGSVRPMEHRNHNNCFRFQNVDLLVQVLRRRTFQVCRETRAVGHRNTDNAVLVPVPDGVIKMTCSLHHLSHCASFMHENFVLRALLEAFPLRLQRAEIWKHRATISPGSLSFPSAGTL